MTDIFGYKAEFLIKTKDNNIKNMFDNMSDFESISATGDLCKFSIKELEELLAYLGTSKKRNLTTIRADVSRIYEYLDYCRPLTAVPLSKEIIEEHYKNKNYHNVGYWLNSIGIYTDFTKTTISKDDMLKINTLDEYDEQEIAFFWLLFLGLKVKEILNIEMKQVSNWKELLKGNIQLSSDIIKNLDVILNSAKNQVFMKNIGIKLKGDKYLFRSHIGDENSPISFSPFYKKFNKLRDYFGKERLTSVDIYKSGMLYFASELINSNNIKSKEEYYSKVFYPICERYGKEPKSYVDTFNDLMNSKALKEYYNITIPEVARERKVTTNTIINPEPWEKTDRKTYREHEELGAKGELLLREKLKLRYSTCHKTKDYSGFDIFVKNNNDDLRCIEVKTMTNKSCSINITENEYRVAHSSRYGEYYWVYIIDMDNKPKPIAYAYKNFFGLLGINNMTDKIFQENGLNGMGSYSYRDFSIKLNEDVFSKSDEHLELSEVCNLTPQKTLLNE